VISVDKQEPIISLMLSFEEKSAIQNILHNYEYLYTHFSECFEKKSAVS